jgi:hypothetical protein
MSAMRIQLVDALGRLIGVASVADEGREYGGTIHLSAAPAEVRELFALFEELVNGQEFSCADEVEAKIDALGIRAILEDGSEAGVSDLQVYPESGQLSLKLSPLGAVNGAAVTHKRSIPS